MARPTWTPSTDEQRAAIAAIERAADAADKTDDALWEAVEAGRKLKIPKSHLAKLARRGRATVYRHVGGRTAEETTRP